MTVIEQKAPEVEMSPVQPTTQPMTWLAVLAVGLLLIVGSYWVGYTRKPIPADDSAEVGFARDMMVHHGQAVEMAVLLFNRTEDETMRILAQDIFITQQGQIGMMLGWLDLWGHSFAGGDASMAWMDMPMDGPMPGMATRDSVNRLQTLQGVEADILFMQLMIPHHQGGVIMAQGALERTEQPQVRLLAETIVNSQTAEIAYMQELLQQKGSAPMPDSLPMDHAGMEMSP